MKFSIIPLENFKKEAKRLLKKYPSLKNDLLNLNSNLENNPQLGTHLGNNVFKIRLSIASKGKGKSGGARVMSFIKVVDKIVYLFSIYNKGDKNSISQDEINEILKSEGLL
jgi:hypothetical protein